MKLPALASDPLTNKAYGFPKRGARRRIKPVVVAVIHITDNPKNQGADAARNERDYANRPASEGPSAHVYVNRDGGGIKAVARSYAAWSNGDVVKPDTSNAGVRKLVQLKAHGYNANEGVGVEIENVGYAKPAGQMTPAQIERCARLVARTARSFGLSINRSTVLAHADINSVDRQRCPALPASREATMQAIIRRARAIRATLK